MPKISRDTMFLSLNLFIHPPLTQMQHSKQIQINSTVFRYLKSIQHSDILPFGSAFPNPELLYNPKFMQLLAQHAKRKHSYLNSDNMPPGNHALRQIIANRYILQGVQCETDDIVITSGALNALRFGLRGSHTAWGFYFITRHRVLWCMASS